VSVYVVVDGDPLNTTWNEPPPLDRSTVTPPSVELSGSDQVRPTSKFAVSTVAVGAVGSGSGSVIDASFESDDSVTIAVLRAVSRCLFTRHPGRATRAAPAPP